MAGIKSHIIQLSKEEYNKKFCKQFANLGTQTEIEKVIEIKEEEICLLDYQQSKTSQVSSNRLTIQSAKMKTAAKGSEDYTKKSQRPGTSMHSSVRLASNNNSIQSRQSSVRSKQRVVMVDAAITCDLIGNTDGGKTIGSKSRTIFAHKPGQPKNLHTNKASETDMSDQARGTGNISKLGPKLLSQLSNESSEYMSQKEEKHRGGSGKQKAILSDSADSQVDLVEIPLGPRVECHFTTKSKKNEKANRSKTQKQNLQHITGADQLATGWRHLNKRLKDLEQVEKRTKSQVKFEVDKAFEMVKYLDETNFSSRDPATSHAYTSMVQMCVNKLDQLTPFMILQKLEEEKRDLKQLLKLDPKLMSQNHSSVAKLLNYVCLENLNNQVLNVFMQVIKSSMPAASKLAEAAFKFDESTPQIDSTNQNNPLANSIKIVENSRVLTNQERERRHNTTETNFSTINKKKESIDKGLRTAVVSNTPRDKPIIRLSSQQPHLSKGYDILNDSSIVIGSPSQKSTANYQRMQQQHHHLASVPRISNESMPTIKSTNLSSVARTDTKQQSSFNFVGSQSEALVQQLISEKGNLRANIEKTFQSNN